MHSEWFVSTEPHKFHHMKYIRFTFPLHFLEHYNTLNRTLLRILMTHEFCFYLQWKSMCHVVFTEEKVWGLFEILCQMIALS